MTTPPAKYQYDDGSLSRSISLSFSIFLHQKKKPSFIGTYLITIFTLEYNISASSKAKSNRRSHSSMQKEYRELEMSAMGVTLTLDLTAIIETAGSHSRCYQGPTMPLGAICVMSLPCSPIEFFDTFH